MSNSFRDRLRRGDLLMGPTNHDEIWIKRRPTKLTSKRSAETRRRYVA